MKQNIQSIKRNNFIYTPENRSPQKTQRIKQSPRKSNQIFFTPQELFNHFKQSNQFVPKKIQLTPVKYQNNLTNQNSTNRQNTIRKKTNKQMSEYTKMMYDRKDIKIEKLEKLRQKKQELFHKLCPFTPKINNIQKDYDLDVVKRNQIWIQNKNKFYRNNRQKSILQQLKHCTFSPNVYSKNNQYYLQQKKIKLIQNKSNAQQIYENNKSNVQQTYQNKAQRYKKIDYQEARSYLQKRILTMHI